MRCTGELGKATCNWLHNLLLAVSPLFLADAFSCPGPNNCCWQQERGAQCTDSVLIWGRNLALLDTYSLAEYFLFLCCMWWLLGAHCALKCSPSARNASIECVGCSKNTRQKTSSMAIFNLLLRYYPRLWRGVRLICSLCVLATHTLQSPWAAA